MKVKVNSTEGTLTLARIKVLKIPVTGNLTGSEEDTGIDLPANSIILHNLVNVEVTAAEATGSTKTIDVGLLSSESGGDADGFIDGLSVASTGYKQPQPVVTVGSNETFYASAQIIGALFRAGFVAGTDVDGNFGLLALKNHLTAATTARSVSITSGSAFSEFRGNVYIPYIEVQEEV